MSTTGTGRHRRLTAPEFQARKRAGERLVMVTAYDATFGQMADEAGVDAILVGDSLGMVIQGADSTLSVTVDEVIYHCRAVARRVERAHLVADMPFMSYQVSVEDALRNAGRMLQVGGAQSVKLEGGQSVAPTIARLTAIGIPVMGHVGLTPQSVHALGGFRVQGRTAEAGETVLRDAHAVAEAGAYAVVLEAIPAMLAERITRELSVPTIGIGAGVACDGQVLVGYDLLGLTPNLKPKFVKRYEELYSRGVEATAAFCREVRNGAFPAAEHSFGAPANAPARPAGDLLPFPGSRPSSSSG